MIRTLGTAALLAAFVLALRAGAQPPVKPPTLEERVTALERQLASVQTRMGVRDTLAPAAGTDTGFALRIAALERTVDRIGTDLQRIERQADNAAREASQARSDALMAQQIARDAQLRAR